MTLKAITEVLVKEIAEIEQFADQDGHLPVEYCPWILCARTQRLNEIANGEGLSGTHGFENKGCYDCKLGAPVCEAYK